MSTPTPNKLPRQHTYDAMDIDAVAEAIRAADPLKMQHPQSKTEYLSDYRRMARAALIALFPAIPDDNQGWRDQGWRDPDAYRFE